MYRKFFAELVGTAVLVIMGCGTAMLVGCDVFGGYLLTALAFGLAIVAMAYSIGNISGCHVNPAVSFGVLMSDGMTIPEFLVYVIAQMIGAVTGTGVLYLIFNRGGLVDNTGAFGANGLASLNGDAVAGLLSEIVLTFIFVMCVLGSTSKKAKHGSFAGLTIGLALTGVHILGIKLTGTSVNPARSFGSALFAAFDGNFEPLNDLWVFVAGPFVGAMLAASFYHFLESSSENEPAAETVNAPAVESVVSSIPQMVETEEKVYSYEPIMETLDPAVANVSVSESGSDAKASDGANTVSDT